MGDVPELGRRSVRLVDLRRHAGATRNRALLLSMLCQATGYRPLPHQLRGHLTDARNKLMLGGIRAGKTYWAACESMLCALANPGCSGAILSPTYDGVIHVQLPLWQELVERLHRAGMPIQRSFSRSMLRADLVGGGSVYFRSFARVDNLRGWGLAWVGIDESEQGQKPTYVYETALGRTSQGHAPMRQIHVSTTPRGLRGVVRLFWKARQSPDMRQDWWLGKAPTAANTHLPEDYLDALEAAYVASGSKVQRAQELEAEIARPQNVVFPEVDLRRHLVHHTMDPALPYYLAADWGTTHPHVLWLQPLDDQAERLVVVDEYCEDNVPRDRLRQVILERAARWGRHPALMAADRAVKEQNAWLMDSFPGAELVTMTSKDEQRILTGIEAVRARLDPVADIEPRLQIAHHLHDPLDDGRGIVRCLQAYRWRVDADGLPTDVPLKDNRHDHGCDALRMLCVALQRSGPPSTVLGSRPADPWKHRKRRRKRWR